MAEFFADVKSEEDLTGACDITLRRLYPELLQGVTDCSTSFWTSPRVVQTLWARSLRDSTSVVDACHMPGCLQMKAFASSTDKEPAWKVNVLALESKNASERRDIGSQ